MAMRLVCLEKAAALHELCRRFSAAERALLEINDIDAAAVLPSGMSLLLPSGKAPEKQRLELYVSKHEDSGQPVSGLVHRASISAPESCTMSGRTAGSERHLPVLALMNLDEGGFVSPALAHRLLTDEESGCQLFQKLRLKLEGEGWGGVLLHMEYLFPFERHAYTDFLSKLEKTVHAAGCWLMVSAPCAAVLAPESREGAAYDIAALAEISDRLLLIPGKPMDGEAAEKCLAELCPLMPMGKLIYGIYPHGCIARSSGSYRLSPVAAHNLAISAASPISRRGARSFAEFSFRDAAGELCRVQYSDALCLSGLFGKLREYGVGGIFCPEVHGLAPAASALFDGLFSVEPLI